MTKHYVPFIAVGLIILAFFSGRGCEGEMKPADTGKVKILQHKNDSLVKITAAYEKRNKSLETFILHQNVKIKRVDSARVKTLSQLRLLQHKKAPCDSILPEAITLIETDTLQINLLQQKTDSLQALVDNDSEIHALDNLQISNYKTMILELNQAIETLQAEIKRVRRKGYIKGFCHGFVAGNITGSSAVMGLH